GSTLNRDQSVSRTTSVKVPANTSVTRPYFTRSSVTENRYTIVDEASLYAPASRPAFDATARYTVEGVAAHITVPVVRREAQLPFGYAMRELSVVPKLAVNVSPRLAIVPLGMPAVERRRVRVQAELV